MQAARGAEGDGALEAWGAYLELVDDLEPDVITAGARRLQSLGRGDLAARLAVSHWMRPG